MVMVHACFKKLVTLFPLQSSYDWIGTSSAVKQSHVSPPMSDNKNENWGRLKMSFSSTWAVDTERFSWDILDNHWAHSVMLYGITQASRIYQRFINNYIANPSFLNENKTDLKCFTLEFALEIYES